MQADEWSVSGIESRLGSTIGGAKLWLHTTAQTREIVAMPEDDADGNYARGK